MSNIRKGDKVPVLLIIGMAICLICIIICVLSLSKM